MSLRSAALLPQTLFLPVGPGVYMCDDSASLHIPLGDLFI